VLAANLGKMDSIIANPVQEEGKVEWIWNEMFQVNDKSIIHNRVKIDYLLFLQEQIKGIIISTNNSALPKNLESILGLRD
jgi:hypothetical protein